MLLPTITITQATRRGWLAAQFRYHKGVVDVVKRLPIRRFVPESKLWEFEPSTVAIEMLEGTGAPIELDPLVKDLWIERGGTLKQATKAQSQDNQKQLDMLELSFGLQLPASSAPKGELPPDFRFITLPHAKQAEGMCYIAANPKLYLAMETGTGKTKLYIDACRLAAHKLKRPVSVLFIGPNKKVPDYRRELRTHAGKEGIDWSWWDARGGARKWEKSLKELGEAPGTLRVIGLNWESLNARTDGMRPDAFDIVIPDELHNAKNPTSQMGAAAARMVEGSMFAYGGSGTPCPQGPFDLWNQVKMLKPGLLPQTFAGHRKRYGVLELAEINGRKFMQVLGYQNIDELARAFNKVSFRALLKECADLPAVIPERQYITMAPEHEAMYRAVMKDGVVLLGPGSQCVVENAALALLRARQVCGGFLPMTDLEGKPAGRSEAILPNRKLDYMVGELLPDLYYSRADRQVVVWAYLRDEVKAILAALRSAPLKMPDGTTRQLRVAELWGDTPKALCDRLDADFRAGVYDIVVSNPQSGGTGLEFQTADREVWYSRDFNLKHRMQAGGRLQRIGQKRQVVRIDLLYENTVEDYVLDSLEAKEDLQSRLTRNPRQVLREAFNVEN